MPDHPLHKRLQDLTKGRLKRTSLNHVLKEQQRKQHDSLAPRPEECDILTHNRTSFFLKAEVKLSIPGISIKSSDSEASLKNTDTSRVGQKLPSHSLDTGLHRRISWKCYTKWRMWHQTSKQASHYYSNIGWRSVLKLQSRSTSTPHRNRDCQPDGDNT